MQLFFTLNYFLKKNGNVTWQIYNIQLYLHMLNLPVGQMVKTPPSQGGVTSSILVRVIYWDIAKLVRHRILVPGCFGSSPNISIFVKVFNVNWFKPLILKAFCFLWLNKIIKKYYFLVQYQVQEFKISKN